MQHKPLILALLAGLSLSGAAQAALNDRGGGLIYDDVLDITWLADANYAKTSGYDTDGLMDWAAATTWAANLTYGGYDDWRLPTSDTCTGYNCTGSEMGHLFYVDLGGNAGLSPILSSGDADLAKFTNLQAYVYWSGLEYAPSPNLAWSFLTRDGSQGAGYKHDQFYAWAVRPGDVAAVPEADTWAMLLAGLGLVGVAARRRRG